MAWTWQTATEGNLKGELSGTSKTLTLKGISGNAITTSPQNTVDTVNIILDIAGKSMVVSNKLEYSNTEGAIEQ